MLLSAPLRCRRRSTAMGSGMRHHRAHLLPTHRKQTYNFLYVQGGLHLKTMTYSESRARYAETLNSVVEDREEVIVTRAGHDPVVIVALDDYQSLRETAYLLRSPANARRLLASIDRLENGGGAEHELPDS